MILSRNTKIAFGIIITIILSLLMSGLYFFITYGYPYFRNLIESSTTINTRITTLTSSKNSLMTTPFQPVTFTTTSTTAKITTTTTSMTMTSNSKTTTTTTLTPTTTTTSTIDPCTIMNSSFVLRSSLNNYWTFCNTYADLVGGVTMYDGVNAQLTNDRYGNSNSALSLSFGYMRVPQGVYFRGDYTIMAWVKIRTFSAWSRLIDFGNGAANDNVFVALTRGTTGYVWQEIWYSSSIYMSLGSNVTCTLNSWQHIAFTYSYPNSKVYLDGVLLGSSISGSGSPKTIIRKNNYIGKSNWNDGLANADIDELKIFDAMLSQSEVQIEMNNNFN